jgi:single-strand DNA-binding protein
VSGINRVTLLGRLAAEPVVFVTGRERTVCTLRLTTDESWDDKDGVHQERTEWHTVIARGKPAARAAACQSKGQIVYVEGRLHSWICTDQYGVVRTCCEVIASRIVPVDQLEGDDRRPGRSSARRGAADGRPGDTTVHRPERQGHGADARTTRDDPSASWRD